MSPIVTKVKGSEAALLVTVAMLSAASPADGGSAGYASVGLSDGVAVLVGTLVAGTGEGTTVAGIDVGVGANVTLALCSETEAPQAVKAPTATQTSTHLHNLRPVNNPASSAQP